MTEFSVPTDELYEAAKEFDEVGKASQLLVERLERATSELEKKWSGAAKQVFFKNYKQWHQTMQGHIALLNSISREMNAMADRFEQADK